MLEMKRTKISSIIIDERNTIHECYRAVAIQIDVKLDSGWL